ncbi:unnamed protein product [Prunus brigantina]
MKKDPNNGPRDRAAEISARSPICSVSAQSVKWAAPTIRVAEMLAVADRDFDARRPKCQPL